MLLKECMDARPWACVKGVEGDEPGLRGQARARDGLGNK